MGLLFQKVDQDDTGGFTECVRCVMTFDALYATGGVLLDASGVPLRVKSRIDSIEFEAHPTYAFDYDRTNDHSGQLIAYDAIGGLAEVANATDLSGVSIACTIKGR